MSFMVVWKTSRRSNSICPFGRGHATKGWRSHGHGFRASHVFSNRPTSGRADFNGNPRPREHFSLTKRDHIVHLHHHHQRLSFTRARKYLHVQYHYLHHGRNCNWICWKRNVVYVIFSLSILSRYFQIPNVIVSPPFGTLLVSQKKSALTTSVTIFEVLWPYFLLYRFNLRMKGTK